MNIAQNWRLNPQRYNLVGTIHEDGSVSFPPRPYLQQRTVEHYDFEEEQPIAVPKESLKIPVRVR